MQLFAGNSVIELAHLIASRLCIKLGNANISHFSDGETSVQINDNVRGSNVFIIQSICAPANDNFMELILIADTLRRSAAKKIIAVIPYFGYARQDRRIRSVRTPITARIVANFLTIAGVNHVLTVDLHSEQVQGFFDIPVDNISSNLVFIKDILQIDFKNPIIVSPDIGGIVRARTIAKYFNNIDIAIIDKRRPDTNLAKAVHIIGNVANRDCILVDDIIDTGGTLYSAAMILKEHKANRVFAYVTHPIFSGNSIKNIELSSIDEIIVCDTIPLSSLAKKLTKIRSLTLSDILAEVIRRIDNEESISAIFKY